MTVQTKVSFKKFHTLSRVVVVVVLQPSVFLFVPRNDDVTVGRNL